MASSLAKNARCASMLLLAGVLAAEAGAAEALVVALGGSSEMVTCDASA